MTRSAGVIHRACSRVESQPRHQDETRDQEVEETHSVFQRKTFWIRVPAGYFLAETGCPSAQAKFQARLLMLGERWEKTW